ncbi:hypothetical protein JHL18_23540 [Clostridium sp. YIM B02505]|uniref:Uncharacterized protein n=1 Tax=Clostridium yunnanense TaxID=2800325 RepID=A0ABS1EW71_9CLOT|nr:hypothetical protein [Clostridium yunnanense]MBK1813595.1 hypothetical protein [Clostridium yunnanense]
MSSIKYSILSMKTGVVQGSFSKIYTIYNYPLIPLFFGVIYNIYFLIKVYKDKN